MDRVRVGIVGTGSIFYGWGGGSGHLHAYRNVREAQVVALCDTNESRLQRAAAALKAAYAEEAEAAEKAGDLRRARDLREDAANLRLYADMDDMLRSAGPDMVDIITPPATHAPLSVKALEAGVNVFCQKPMARTWLECLPVLDAVEKSGKLFGCAENMIFESPWYDAKKLTDAGVVGEPLLMFISFGISEALPVRWSPEFSGGGALTDMGIHAVMTAWYICGFRRVPARVQAVRPVGVAVRMPERLINGTLLRVEVEDDAHIVFELADPETGSGAAVHIEASWSGQDRPGNRLIGSSGELEIGSPLRVKDAWGNVRDVPLRQPLTGYAIAEGAEPGYSGFVGMVHEMCRAIQTGARPLCTAERAADGLAVIGAAYLSELHGGRSVGVEEFKQFALDLREKEGARAADVFIRRVCDRLQRRAGAC